MTFKLPEIGRREVDILTRKALDAACWDLSFLQDNDSPEHSAWIEAAERSGAKFKAWVDYGRQSFPNEPSGYMLDYEKHWGAGLPFERGDVWEFDSAADSWAIVKPKKRIVTRESR